MPAGAASRYALGADGVGAARPAPAAIPISASRYALAALGARRCAPRALRACVPGGAAAGCHRRLALRARRRWRGRLRQPSRGLTLRARRRWRGRCAPGRLHVFPPIPDNCARCLLVVGILKTSCASRCSRRLVQAALRAPAEGEGGEGCFRHHDARACGGTLACHRTSMCSASRRAAPLQPERLIPRPDRSPALFERVQRAVPPGLMIGVMGS